MISRVPRWRDREKGNAEDAESTEFAEEERRRKKAT
jgi:hypothetical protein